MALIAQYLFNGNSNDSIGGNNGTDTAISYVTGFSGQGASFNGTNSRITTGSAITTGTSATFSFWINKNASTDQCFFIEEAYSNNSMCFWNSSSNQINYRFGASNMVGSTVNAISTGTFALVTITHTGTTGKIYINGVLNSNATVNAKTSSGTSITFGSLTPSIYFLNGIMDDFRVYNTALSDAEVLELYNSYFSTFIPRVMIS